ncbi:MAG: phosphoenolpyruvate carboxykinase (ATP), partial [Pseudomonadota bacterium]
MINSGIHNPANGPQAIGQRVELVNPASIRWNDDEQALYDLALKRGEGVAAANGPLAVETGKHTGRSATDKYIVRDSGTEQTVWWDNNQQMSEQHFDVLLADFLAHTQNKDLLAQDLFGGADPAYRLNARIYVE